jgi:methanogenic corrinoid protein MtbC1
MKNVVEAAKVAGIRDKVTIMVGGAPVTDSFCKNIGADIYTPDAASAADEAARVCKAS